MPSSRSTTPGIGPFPGASGAGALRGELGRLRVRQPDAGPDPVAGVHHSRGELSHELLCGRLVHRFRPERALRFRVPAHGRGVQAGQDGGSSRPGCSLSRNNERKSPAELPQGSWLLQWTGAGSVSPDVHPAAGSDIEDKAGEIDVTKRSRVRAVERRHVVKPHGAPDGAAHIEAE